MRHRLVSAAVIAILSIPLTACGGSAKPPPPPTFAERAGPPLALFAAANQNLSAQASRLSPSTSKKRVGAMLDANLEATRTAQAAITALGPNPSEPLSVPLSGVFEAQKRYLREAADAVESPSRSAARDLKLTYETLVNAYAGLTGRVPGLAVPQGVDELAAWVAANSKS